MSASRDPVKMVHFVTEYGRFRFLPVFASPAGVVDVYVSFGAGRERDDEWRETRFAMLATATSVKKDPRPRLPRRKQQQQEQKQRRTPLLDAS